MNKIPMSSLAITLRTMYCYPAIELRPRQKIFVPPQPKNRVTINYPTYLRPTYVICTSYTPVTRIIKMRIVVGHHTGHTGPVDYI
jgi:hypothetical protein